MSGLELPVILELLVALDHHVGTSVPSQQLHLEDLQVTVSTARRSFPSS
jgi:hypothetical protein